MPNRYPKLSQITILYSWTYHWFNHPHIFGTISFHRLDEYDKWRWSPTALDVISGMATSWPRDTSVTVGVGKSLWWCHNGHGGVANHQPHHYLRNRLVRRRSKKTSKLRVTGLCEGNSPVTGVFPAQMASNAENVSIWWRHHIMTYRGSPHMIYSTSLQLCKCFAFAVFYCGVMIIARSITKWYFDTNKQNFGNFRTHIKDRHAKYFLLNCLKWMPQDFSDDWSLLVF